MTHAMSHDDQADDQAATEIDTGADADDQDEVTVPLTVVPGTVVSVSPGRNAVLNRVRRAQGQLAGVLRMLEDERDPQAVLHQLKAVSGALDRAGFALVAHEWRERSGLEGADADERLGDIEKLFLALP